MAKENTFTKYTVVGGAIAIMVGFFEGLGNYLFNHLSSFQGISFSPYVIPAVLGIAGFSLILYDFVKKRREKQRRDEDENWRFFPANTS
jgi:preprotein translocase subunit SecF